MTAKLIAEEGVLKGLVLSLEEGDQWIIGRDPDACQLLVEDPSASRQHLLCRKTPEGIVLENLSATNPAEVNGKIVKEPRLLRHGDAVKIGQGIFQFYAESEARLLNDRVVENEVPTGENIEAPLEIPVEEVAPKEDQEEQAKKKQEELEPRHDTIFGEEETNEKKELAEINFGMVESGRWLLKVVGGPNTGAEFSLQTSHSYLLGTDTNACDIVFHDTSVSRQHAKISIDEQDVLTIEDLKSRNGTVLDAKPLVEKQILPPNAYVSLGTTSFVVYDREGEMQTIMSPLLPSIVKFLQKEEPEKKEEKPLEVPSAPNEALRQERQEKLDEKNQERARNALSAFILIAIITALFVAFGFAISTLFRTEPVVENVIDVDKILAEALGPFSEVKYSFNKATGRLLLVGHVLTLTEKNQLMYNLQGLNFIKNVDDTGVIIDELVLTETNQLLARNPNWRGLTIHSPLPGHFVLSGYLQSRQQAGLVWDYINRNFPYIDLLENKIIVEEDLLNSMLRDLNNQGFYNVKVQISNGDLAISGNFPRGKGTEFQKLIESFKTLPGIRGTRVLATEVAPEESLINISSKYQVTGFSRTGTSNLSVVINGRIVSQGDTLDGMTVVKINPNSILLEKDSVRYRIDYNQ